MVADILDFNSSRFSWLVSHRLIENINSDLTPYGCH